MKSLLLMSGGIDSTALAYQLKNDDANFDVLHFNFGQNASTPEFTSVKKVCGKLDINYDIIDMPDIRNIFNSSKNALFTVLPNPGKHVLELGTLLIFTHALLYARKNNYSKILIGFSKLDAEYSKEYSKEFLVYLSNISRMAGYEDIQIEAPFIEMGKHEIINIIKNEKELIDFSWSCVYDGDKPCGYCQACSHRIDATNLIGIKEKSYEIAFVNK
jgi:7-cyano-7-deazaguanine synthase